MRGVITVVTHEEYVLWLAKQKPNYAQIMGDQAPAGGAKPDSTKAAANLATPAAKALTSGPAANLTTAPPAAKLVATN